MVKKDNNKKHLTLRIGERKARLAPIIKELRPLRQQSQDMQAFLLTLRILQKQNMNYFSH